MEEIGLSDYIWMLKQRRFTIGIVTLVVLLIAGIILAVMPRTYLGEATLIFPAQQNQSLSSQLTQLSNLPMLNGALNYSGQDIYTSVLKSRAISASVLEDLDLHAKYGLKRKDLIDNLVVGSAKGSNGLNISFGARTSWLKGRVSGKDVDGETARLAAEITNTYVQELRAYCRSNSLFFGKKNRVYIEEQIARTRMELTASEGRLETFQKANPTLVPPEKSSTYADQVLEITSKQMENDIALADVKSQVEEARRTWRAKSPDGVSPEAFVNNPVVLDLQQQLAKLEVRRATLLEEFTESHPAVIGITQEISKLRSKIRAEVSRVVDGKTANLNPAHEELLKELVQQEIVLHGLQARRLAFAGAIAGAERRAAVLPVKEMEYMRLLRDLKAKETVYTTLLAEHAKAQVTEGQDADSFVVLDSAEPEDKPDSPKVKLSIAFALVFGLILGVWYATAMRPAKRK